MRLGYLSVVGKIFNTEALPEKSKNYKGKFL